LAGNRVNGSGNGARSGAQTLLLLATPLNVLVLRALAEGPKQQAELRRAAGLPAQTTLRAQLKRLTDVGAVEKHRRNRFPGVHEYELTAAGRDLLFVADVLERWLERAPDGPLALGENAAKAAIKALAEGWSTTMLRVLAAGPLSLTELDGIITSLSYPALERRLAAMRLASLVKARASDGRGTPCGVTNWLRQGVAPLASAIRWERRHLPRDTAPIARLDIEAAFLLALPLLRLPSDVSGSCRMAAEMANGGERRLAGAMIELRNGKIASCATQLRGDPDAWALGSAPAWLDALIARDADRLELGGDCQLASALVDALHQVLFASVSPTALDLESSISDDGVI
jgi:DNA-binding HxlR family transcriptional regulator